MSVLLIIVSSLTWEVIYWKLKYLRNNRNTVKAKRFKINFHKIVFRILSLLHRYLCYIDSVFYLMCFLWFIGWTKKYIYLEPSTWYCNTRLMRSSGDKYNSTFGKALRAISLACSPGTILYTSRSNILSRLQTPTTLLHIIIIKPQRYKPTHTR